VFDDVSSSTLPSRCLRKADVIYTHEPRLVHAPSWQLTLAAEFSRSIVLNEKHHDVRLFRVERVTAR
jgi:hypothetical protein